jgi:type I restriction enzyme, S subunit
MFGLQQKHIDAINACFAQYPTIEQVILYGSRAKGNYKNGSDIDLTIVGDLDYNTLLKLDNQLDDLLLPYKIDLSVRHKINNPDLQEHIERVGNVFYEKEKQLAFQEPEVEYGKNTGGWKTYKLGEVVDIKYGKDHKHLADGEIPLYGSGGIMRYVDMPLYEQESILIPRKGTLSNLFYLNIPFWSVDTMFYTKIKEGNNGKYLYYLLKSMDLATMNVGSAVPSLTTEVLNKVEINIPDTSTQTQIATILSSLDDKIALNLQMNQTLEAMAQAIFKEWFVDFNFPGFDGELVEGLPKGWRMGKLSTICTIKYGKDHKYLEDGNIPVYGSGGIMRYAERALYEQESILIPRKGTLSNLFYVTEPFWSVDTMFYTIINEVSIRKYLFYSLKHLNLSSMNVGSAVPSLTTEVLNKIDILVPDNELLGKFEDMTSTFYQKMNENNKNIQTLTQLRDTLLPKLMSGQIPIQP